MPTPKQNPLTRSRDREEQNQQIDRSNRKRPAMFQDDFWMIGNPSPSPSSSQSPSPSPWSRLQDKLFERALVIFSEQTPDRWQKIAGQVPGKTPVEVREHYEALVYDVSEIDSGRVELPSYADNSFTPGWASECGTSQISFSSKQKQTETERKKGIPWTEEEHRLFLIGLQKYGKGDWRSISRNAVVSRTPTQVASHAQKYYLRLNSMKKEKKRSSIHDITTVESNPVAQPSNQSLVAPLGDPDQPTMQAMGPPTSFHGQGQGCSSVYQRLGFPM